MNEQLAQELSETRRFRFHGGGSTFTMFQVNIFNPSVQLSFITSIDFPKVADDCRREGIRAHQCCFRYCVGESDYIKGQGLLHLGEAGV